VALILQRYSLIFKKEEGTLKNMIRDALLKDIHKKEILVLKQKEGNVDFRCYLCYKLLAKENAAGKIAGSIKCPRCGKMNEI
jgi:hypothetical protein